LCSFYDGRRAAALVDKRQGISDDDVFFLFCELLINYLITRPHDFGKGKGKGKVHPRTGYEGP